MVGIKSRHRLDHDLSQGQGRVTKSHRPDHRLVRRRQVANCFIHYFIHPPKFLSAFERKVRYPDLGGLPMIERVRPS